MTADASTRAPTGSEVASVRPSPGVEATRHSGVAARGVLASHQALRSRFERGSGQADPTSVSPTAAGSAVQDVVAALRAAGADAAVDVDVASVGFAWHVGVKDSRKAEDSAVVAHVGVAERGSGSHDWGGLDGQDASRRVRGQERP